MKRAIIIHGWGGTPKEGWIPMVKRELEAKGFAVDAPQMPNTDSPVIDHWVSHLEKIVGKPGEDTCLIGHSIGCQTILRYLQKLPSGVKVGGVLFIGGWITLSEEVTGNPEEREIARPWLETPLDLKAAARHASKFVALFSDDDPYVPETNWKTFEKFGKIFVEHGKGHLTERSSGKVILEKLALLGL